MECLLIPGLLLMLVLISVGIAETIRRDGVDFTFGVMALVLAALLFFALIFCPINYLDTRSQALELTAYYEYIIQPHVIEDAGDYVVVDSNQAGLWQAGQLNLATYNARLRVLRYWDSIPLVGSVVYPPPAHLKFATVA